jgi:hypothetical protein
MPVSIATEELFLEVERHYIGLSIGEADVKELLKTTTTES